MSLAKHYRCRCLLHPHTTILACPTCGAFMEYEPPDPRDVDAANIGVLGCPECGHAEPAELVREYEAASRDSND